MMYENNDGIGGFLQPGARSTRQENKETELVLPGLQALLRSGADILAAFLVMGALLVLGRWAIWAMIFYLLFSESYDVLVDDIVGRVNDPAATLVDMLAQALKWTWPFVGYAFLRVLIPVTWTWKEMLWQRSVLEFAWPFLFNLAVPWALPVTIGMRIVILVVMVAPLFTWGVLRDRLQWALWEFTPYGPVNVAEQGLDPRQWGPKAEPQAVPEAKGVIFEVTDYQPHVKQINSNTFLSNGMGGSHRRVNMAWVTREQWETVARLLLANGESFSEDTLGKGNVFSTHGPTDRATGEKMGYRLFARQMLEAQRVQYRGGSPNTGLELTEAGEEFLRRVLEGDVFGGEDNELD
jgi:hypothetical protein